MAAAVKHFRFLPVCVCVCVCVDSRPKAVTSSGINDTARCAPRPRPGLLQLTGFCKMWGQVFSRHASEKKKEKRKKRRRRRIQSYVSVLPESSGEDERSLLLITAAGWREQVDQSFIFHSSVTVKPRRGRRRRKRRRRRSELSRLPAG